MHPFHYGFVELDCLIM